MATVRKNVALSFSLLTATVNVVSALVPKERNVTVCTGAGGHPEHDPMRIKQESTCAQCGTVGYHELHKAREVSDGLVLLTAEDITAVAQDATQWKAKMTLTPHPGADVETSTAPGGKAYYLEPVGGHEQSYQVIVAMVQAHPELAFVTRWTPRSTMGVFRLIAHDGVLLMQERVAGDKVQPAPTFAPVDVPEALLGMAEQVLGLDGVIAPFDLDTYKDTAEEKLAAIVASRTVQTELARELPGGAPVPVQDAMAALQAMLGTKAKPAKAKKATAKKTTTRKATVKKAS